MTESISQEELLLRNQQTGRWLLFSLLAFFITFAVVDAFFVYKAVSTHSGVVVENAYEIGLHYNDIIAQAREEKSAGKEMLNEMLYPKGDLQKDPQHKGLEKKSFVNQKPRVGDTPKEARPGINMLQEHLRR